MKNAWEILELTPTEDKRIVKKAYAKMLTKYHPEDHPEEFKIIQEAYQSILKSFNRDYQKTMNYASDFKESFHRKNSEYIQEEQFEEDLKKETMDTNQQSADFYDDLNLSWSFHDESQQKESIGDVYESHEEVLKAVHEDLKENYEENLTQYLYEHFLERMKFSWKLETMQALILNQTFFENMQDEEFYHKITNLIQKNYHLFDSLTVSFLFDAFSYIEDSYGYADHDENNITNFIHAKKLSQRNEYKRRERMGKVSAVVIFLCICVVFVMIQGARKEARDSKEELRQRVIESSMKSYEETIDLRKENVTILNKYMLDTYGSEYSCNILALEFLADSSVFLSCENIQEEGVSKTGFGHLGKDKLLDEIRITEVESTQSE